MEAAQQDPGECKGTIQKPGREKIRRGPRHLSQLQDKGGGED